MKCREDNITQEYLKSILDYDPETGIFKWRVRKAHCIQIGDIAGTKDSSGYVIISIDNILYKAHRLAFLYINGWLPEQVDHINVHDSKSDNKICNLRKATESQNQHNRIKYKNNKSGYKGVTWHKATEKWMAAIKINKKSVYLGLFSDPQEAAEAYKQAAIQLHGEYARVN